MSILEDLFGYLTEEGLNPKLGGEADMEKEKKFCEIGGGEEFDQMLVDGVFNIMILSRKVDSGGVKHMVYHNSIREALTNHSFGNWCIEYPNNQNPVPLLLDDGYYLTDIQFSYISEL